MHWQPGQCRTTGWPAGMPSSSVACMVCPAAVCQMRLPPTNCTLPLQTPLNCADLPGLPTCQHSCSKLVHVHLQVLIQVACGVINSSSRAQREHQPPPMCMPNTTPVQGLLPVLSGQAKGASALQSASQMQFRKGLPTVRLDCWHGAASIQQDAHLRYMYLQYVYICGTCTCSTY
jgi:hypothetical protein